MKNIHIKDTLISAGIIWTLGVTAFVASYFVPIMSDPDVQANWTLSLVLIPVATLGAHIYYRKGHTTNGFALGTAMFLVTILLDALITVPFLIMPNGGNYISFFADPNFWFLAAEYISVVAAYWQIERAVERTQTRKA